MQAGEYQYPCLTDEESEFWRGKVACPNTHRWKRWSRFSRPAPQVVAQEAIWIPFKCTEFLQPLWSHSPRASAWLLEPLFPVLQWERGCREEAGAQGSLSGCHCWPMMTTVEGHFVWFLWVCPSCAWARDHIQGELGINELMFYLLWNIRNGLQILFPSSRPLCPFIRIRQPIEPPNPIFNY